MAGAVGVDGKIVSGKNASLMGEMFEHLFGYGVFTSMRTYSGKIFRLEEHAEGLMDYADTIGLSHPFTREGVCGLCRKVLAKSALKEAFMRAVISEDIYAKMPPRLFVFADKLSTYADEYYKNGAIAVTVRAERLVPRAKTLSYLPSIRALRAAKATGAVDAILVDKSGSATESAVANLFIVKGNRVITPKENMLFGITRKAVLGIAAGEYNVAESDIHVSELYSADEVFLTGTSKEVMPIVSIDGRAIGSGKPGEVTLDLLARFRELVRSETSK